MRLLRGALGCVLVLLLAPAAGAESETPVKDAARQIGHDAKAMGKKIGKAAKEVGHDIANASKRAYNGAKKQVKKDFGSDGADKKQNTSQKKSED